MILFRIVAVMVCIVLPGALSAQDTDSTVVDAVAFEGNRAISSRDLKLLMFTRANPWYEVFPGVDVRTFDPSVFRSDIARILARYKDEGYFETALDTLIDRTRPGFVRIRIRIEEGEPVVVSNVRLAFLPADAGRDSVASDGCAGHPTGPPADPIGPGVGFEKNR